MLNELITWVLNTYLGKYLENFNPDQLSVALVSGEVELENVPIRKDALRSFGIPVEAISGSIGKIKLQIPVRQFRTSPWSIVIERVYGVFGPKNLNEWDNEKEKQDEYDYKLSILNAKESSWRLENDCNVESYYSLSYSSWLNYGATLATNILENLELKIVDVHLRYEDSLSSPKSPFSAGIRIQSISVQTCDNSWLPGSKNDDFNNVSYKLLELKNLCLYWDQLYEINKCSKLSSTDLLVKMGDLCKIENHRFVVNPINATAKFKRERCKKAIRNKNRPRICCDVELPEFVLEINKVQYNEAIKCMSYLHDIERIRTFKMTRPAVDVTGNAKVWWKYASAYHGFYFHSSEEKWKIAKDNIRYINIVKRILINASENLSKEERQFKIEMEQIRRLDELEFLRDICYKNVSAKRLNMKYRNVNQYKNILYHWFPNWLGWYGNTASASDEYYEKIEDDILNAIKETIENDRFPNRDAIFANFSFSLSDGRISLTSGYTTKDMVALEMEFQNLKSFIEIKPKFYSYCIGISLGLVCFKDKLTELTEFPYIIKPKTHDNQKSFEGNLMGLFTKKDTTDGKEPWFQLQYEKNPPEHKSDFRLTINSKSLDVVYNEFIFKWLVNFFTEPINDSKQFIYFGKKKKNYEPRLKFFNNWKSVLMGQKGYKKNWSFEIDISAPRIICVENFKEITTSVFVIDFGRFQLLKNEGDNNNFADEKNSTADMESEDELFMTPCSTPPGSKISPPVSPTTTTCLTSTGKDMSTSSKIIINKDTGLENTLRSEMYDKYIINLTDLQVLVCKNREWRPACFKSSSSFHLLDKFNISIQLERRTVNTSEPKYPSITLFGNLTKIVAHINEQKIIESLRILNKITLDVFKQTTYSDINPNSVRYEKMFLEENNDENECSNTIIFQFAIGQMILDVQSKEKSIAELQILGAKAGLSKQTGEININMSVHGFLLVDAIQSFGHDFELLVASHRSIEIDSISGSLKQSEPCSPVSPGSPDPNGCQRPTSPHFINKIVNDLHLGRGHEVVADNALITIEINIIGISSGVEPIQIANITFNNLDVIANQETIVELLSFGKRIVDNYRLFYSNLKEQGDAMKTMDAKELIDVEHVKTEVNFDFHRLNILVLRRSQMENAGRKVGTLTMSEAKIHAKLGNDMCVAGALGGIQIIDITPENINHQRIFSVGIDPLTDPPNQLKNDELYTLTNEMYGMYDDDQQNRNALTFKITQSKHSQIVIRMRMASVWYTHCPRFIEEIYLCVKEFKQYFKNFLKSLRNKATHMAKGLVQHISSTTKNNNKFGDITLDVILSTPVLVLPRSRESSEVLVANLGKITINNTQERFESCPEILTTDIYFVDIRNVNLCSLNINKENYIGPKFLPKANEFYSCQKNGMAILYDTALMFKFKNVSKSSRSDTLWNASHTLSINGSVTESLNICLSKSQYEQLTDSLYYATNISLLTEPISSSQNESKLLDETKESKHLKPVHFDNICVQFSVPIFKLDLQNEHNISLIHITFQEFSFYHNDVTQQKQVQVLLRSVIMEDLKCPTNSKYRNMVDSTSDNDNNHLPKNNLSNSCSNLSDYKSCDNIHKSVSMPININETTICKTINKIIDTKSFQKEDFEINQRTKTKNLVIYRSDTKKYADSKRPDEIKSSIDFNSLNLIISIEKWFMVFDFFGLTTNQEESSEEERKLQSSNDQTFSQKELKVLIRSLNLILVKNESELSKANISNIILDINKANVIESVDGKLGSVSLFDLTPYGFMYRERFSTSGREALSFTYKRNISRETNSFSSESLHKDANLIIFMSSVKYVHTKRFIVEIHLFMKELIQLQSPVMKQFKKNESKRIQNRSAVKIGLEVHAESPIILLPVSYNSNHLLIADLGKFTLLNNFYFANDIISLSEKRSDSIVYNEIVDLMNIDLVNINVLTGERENNERGPIVEQNSNVLHIGNFNIVKLGNTIFKEKCHLKLQVIRNTDSDISHNIPDIEVKGTLSELHGFINLQQYKLIRGFLDYNLGENIDDVYYNFQVNVNESIEKLCSITKVKTHMNNKSNWTTLSMNFLLENVIIFLAESVDLSNDNSNSTLACIKFIKSTLEIDSFSDGSQDIDLISSEILVLDARENFEGSTSHNIFKYILKPSVQSTVKSLVQAEIHSRKRNDASKYTILLNNMRIMAILDYLEKLNDFLKEDPYMSLEIHKTPQHERMETPLGTKCGPNLDNHPKYEFVLNITNSEIVFVENNDQVDTNAIILKSTTVYSYKPNNTTAPISIDINHLEIFSCILGSENESSQSIIDPFTLNMELRNNCFQIQIQDKIFLRISYNDAMLFSRIMQSIPKQTNKHVIKNYNYQKDIEKIAPLVAMGFKYSDCWHAMEFNNFNINEAAIWLSQQQQQKQTRTALQVSSITLNANSIFVCIIDDCLDADVPLLEVSLLNLMINQKIQTKTENNTKFFEGEIDAKIASDYYNRHLSGWEPITEPWQCIVLWKYSKCAAAKNKRLSIQASSKQVLKLNITSTLLELCDLVHTNWTEEYLKHSFNKNTAPCMNANVRRRLPFVPFALKNLTGEPLIFKIFYSHGGGITRTEGTQQDLMCNWISANHNEIVPFDYGPQSKQRHMDSHKLNMHQILVQIHGWTLIGPISIDKVGTFFRYASQDMQYNKKTRIVFEISLVGSAQKLIIVRSALNIVNKTMNTFSLRLKLKNEKDAALLKINPLEKLTIPLGFVDSYIYLKPHSIEEINDNGLNDNGFCARAIQWTSCITTDCVQDILSRFSPNKISFHVLVEIKKDKYPIRDIISMPGHTITIIPPLKLKNLLCCDLIFKITGHTQGRLNASEEVEIYSIDINESICLSITIDNYKLSSQLKIPMGHTGIVEPKLKLIDMLNRELFLRVSIQSFQGGGMEIFIGAPIWLINKTGLPLVFRQEGTNQVASGQFDEHEYAREVSPLMFSFSDQEGSPLIEFRLGKSFGNNNKWCKSFGIHKETNSRELMAEQSKVNYVIGVNIQRSTGLYNCTTFITFTPRFQLYNRSQYRLEFAQKCDIKEMEITSTDKVIVALQGCNFPFHWPNCEHEQFLCVRVADDEYSHWSSGLPINGAKSIYINVRNTLGEMMFLRLEVIRHGGTYILHFTDAYSLPPPIRIDNYSEVQIYFSQKGIERDWRTNVKPQSSLAYVLDDPMGPQALLIEAPGGHFVEYSINKCNSAKSITYANFIYIAFKETFRLVLPEGDNQNVGIEGQQLVLGVKDKRVIISKKCTGDRSQLWLMNSYGQLEHEGTSPPNELLKPTNTTPRFVLDLEKPPNPNDYTRLVVRPQNNQRVTTQTWRFENGRLMCHANMCVQAANGIYGMQPGFDAVLGKMETPSKASNSNNIPFDQSIEIQKLRPGSGHLEVINKMDGPIKTIQIHDVKVSFDDIVLVQDPLWDHASIFNKVITDNNYFATLDELTVKLMLPKGLGISIITRSPCEELAYISLEDIVFSIMLLPFTKSVDLKVGDLQIDNQLLDTQCPIVMHTWKSNTENINQEALVFKMKLLQSPYKNAVIFECFIFEVKPCAVILEERFILKTVLFLGYKKHEHREEEETGNHLYRINEYPFSKNSKRFYFEECLIGSTQVRLSVLTSSKLNSELVNVKKSFGLTVIKFEDAVIEFEKFSDRHHFETLEVYVKALKAHYFNQLKWHAASILGSVDFLGNPLGFANDLSEGVSGLIFEGSVKSLVKNVTHGLSNSTAKLTETLSDSLGRVVLDEHDNETRQKILEVAYPTSGSHLAAGLKGFGFGLLGGVTSIVRHTYVGALSDGLPGFFSGLGRGIVGTVTKPLIGVLDLASETAIAVRETSRGSHHYLPDRKRLPRCVTGAPGGLLPLYSYRQSKGQQYLYIINRRSFGEKLIFYEPNLCNDKEAQLRLLVSTEYVRIFSRCEEDPAIMFECHLSEVLSCHPLITNTTTSSKVLPNFYIEISTNVPKVTRPRVRCQNEEIAERASRCINYAKAVFDERELSVANF